MDKLTEILAVWQVHDALAAAGYRPTPEQMAPGDWVWWWSPRDAKEQPMSRILLRDNGNYLVAYRGPCCEWCWAWVPFRAITGHVPAGAVRGATRPPLQRERRKS